MMGFLTRLVAVTLLWGVVMPQAQQRIQHVLAQQLNAILAPIQFDQDDLYQEGVASQESLRFAASSRKSKATPVIKLPPLTRTRIVQAFPIDPAAVPSMVVASAERS